MARHFRRHDTIRLPTAQDDLDPILDARWPPRRGTSLLPPNPCQPFGAIQCFASDLMGELEQGAGKYPVTGSGFRFLFARLSTDGPSFSAPRHDTVAHCARRLGPYPGCPLAAQTRDQSAAAQSLPAVRGYSVLRF